jgi:hypothetical protein
MAALARNEEDTDIALRINHFQKAVASAEKAIAYLHGSKNEKIAAQLMADSLSDLKDTLEIAVFQQQALMKLAAEFDSYNYTTPASRARYSDSQRRPLDLMEQAVVTCRFKLLSITELFHEICSPYKLWDVCLLLLHASKHDDSDLVGRLWRSLIFRYVLLFCTEILQCDIRFTLLFLFIYLGLFLSMEILRRVKCFCA